MVMPNLLWSGRFEQSPYILGTHSTTNLWCIHVDQSTFEIEYDIMLEKLGLH